MITAVLRDGLVEDDEMLKDGKIKTTDLVLTLNKLEEHNQAFDLVLKWNEKNQNDPKGEFGFKFDKLKKIIKTYNEVKAEMEKHPKTLVNLCIPLIDN